MAIANNDEVLYRCNPVMFRAQPFRFLVASAFIPIGIGIAYLVLWWLDCKSRSLTISRRRTSLRRGIISRFLNEVDHEHVRNVLISQTMFQRLLNTGSIGISSSGQAGVEIAINGIARPMFVKRLIESRGTETGHSKSVPFDVPSAIAICLTLYFVLPYYSAAWAYVSKPAVPEPVAPIVRQNVPPVGVVPEWQRQVEPPQAIEPVVAVMDPKPAEPVPQEVVLNPGAEPTEEIAASKGSRPKSRG